MVRVQRASCRQKDCRMLLVEDEAVPEHRRCCRTKPDSIHVGGFRLYILNYSFCWSLPLDCFGLLHPACCKDFTFRPWLAACGCKIHLLCCVSLKGHFCAVHNTAKSVRSNERCKRSSARSSWSGFSPVSLPNLICDHQLHHDEMHRQDECLKVFTTRDGWGFLSPQGGADHQHSCGLPTSIRKHATGHYVFYNLFLFLFTVFSGV